MDNRLPLLTLPANVLKNVLLNMEFPNVLTLSLFSKRAHSLISKNWLRPPRSSRLYIGYDYVNLHLWFVRRHTTIELQPVRPGWILENPECFQIKVCENGSKLEVLGITVKKCIQNFLKVLSIKKGLTVEISRHCRPHVSIIQNFLEGFSYDRLALEDHPNREFTQNLLQVLPPPEQYEVHRNPFFNPQKLFIESSQYLQLFTPAVRIITFDDLLFMNSECVELDWSDVSDKFVNRYLKLWIKGCHRRLKYLEIKSMDFEEELWRDMNVEEIMRGIPHKIVAEKRKFQIPFTDDKRPHWCSNGMDIVRFDGKAKASIFIRGESILQMFVSHC